MKASDLRIGNLVYNVLKEVITVDSIRDAGVNGYSIETIKPIPLTEEWLLKFGFDKYRTDKAINYKKGLLRFTFANKGVFKGKNFLMIANIINYKNINHVHQLQNLYFALTGEELKLKQND